MLVEIGPVPVGDMRQWARFARRMLCELRTAPGDLDGIASRDFIEACRTLVDDWDQLAARTDHTFRWTGELDPDQGEFLLHGITRCLCSDSLNARVTEGEATQHGPITMHVVRSLATSLTYEGRGHQHLCDQVQASLGAVLEY